MEAGKLSSTPVARVSLAHLPPVRRAALPHAFGALLDAAGTATGRATFYNSLQEQEAALDAIHRSAFEIERGAYAATLLLRGVTDYTRQLGVRRLLSSPYRRRALLSAEQEWAILERTCADLPPQRMLKLFDQLRQARLNNARTRRLILRTLLGVQTLELWAVRYRRKLAAALQHAWGRRGASIVRAIAAKRPEQRTDRERKIMRQRVGRFLPSAVNQHDVEQCVRFALGDEQDLTLPRLRAYHDAKAELTEGRGLPFEVLEGIRSSFHRHVRPGQILEISKHHLTSGQQLTLQRTAQKDGVTIQLDPTRYDPVRLYLYAFEMGMTHEIRCALQDKAVAGAECLPVRFEHVGIVLDTSASMNGHTTQKRRPVATTLALRDALCAAADRATLVTSDGRPTNVGELTEPRGDTSLAAALVSVLRAGPEIVFVVSDGYENAPAGAVSDVMRVVRRLGVRTPVFQASPVFAADAYGVRTLSDQVPAMAVRDVGRIGLGLLKAMLYADAERGVAALLDATLPRLTTPDRPGPKLVVTSDVRKQA